jgi:phosphoribosylformylglycinamidine synthase
LNFGNPYDKEVYYQFKHSIDGMREACLKFNTPVTGGNVSFYNQSTEGVAVYPTPTIGMVGILEKPEHQTGLAFKEEGDLIYLIGQSQNDISSSQYLAKYHKVAFSPAPWFDLDEEKRLQDAVYESIEKGFISSAHDVSEGGLFVTLMESAMNSHLGFRIQSDNAFRKDAWLFGEGQSRVVLTVKPSERELLENHFGTHGLNYQHIGEVKGGNALIDGEDFGSIDQLKSLYDNAIGNALL